MDGKEYAKVGDRYYTRHAVDRTQPSGMRYSSTNDGNVRASRITRAGEKDYGRSISPNYVNDVINTGVKQEQIVNGVTRTAYTSGTVTVITENEGRIIVTILTK